MAVLIILLALSTLGVLFLGLGGFIAGGAFNEKYGNRLMQARVALQAITLLLIMIALFASGSHWVVKLDKIYTRGGDTGQTSLGDGRRVAKHDLRVAAYGTADEANSVLGLARLHTAGDEDAMLARIQNDLFDLGADLCTPQDGRKSEGALRVTAGQVGRLEAEIDAMNDDLAPLASFILPGGQPAAAWLHLARTVVRRSERLMTELSGAEQVNPEAIKYMNRLSDHLFVLARRLNDNGESDVLWQPGATR